MFRLRPPRDQIPAEREEWKKEDEMGKVGDQENDLFCGERSKSLSFSAELTVAGT